MAAEFERSDAGFEQPITERKITPSRVTEEQIIESAQTKLVLDKIFVVPIGTASTVDVANLKVFKCNNLAPAIVDEFINGQDGQPIKILGDGFTTIEDMSTNGNKIHTNTDADKLLEVNRFYQFLNIDGIWYEQGA